MVCRPGAQLMALDDGTPFFCSTVVKDASTQLRLTFKSPVDLYRSVRALKSEFSGLCVVDAQAACANATHVAEIELDVATDAKRGSTQLGQAVAELRFAQNGRRILREIML